MELGEFEWNGISHSHVRSIGSLRRGGSPRRREGFIVEKPKQAKEDTFRRGEVGIDQKTPSGSPWRSIPSLR